MNNEEKESNSCIRDDIFNPPLNETSHKSSKNSSLTELNKLPVEPQKSNCNLFFYIIKNGLVCGTTLLISMFIMSSEMILIGHLPNSKVFLSAKENTNMICRFFQMTIMMFNTGLLICISRCSATRDVKGINHFIKMNFWFISMASYIFVMVIVLYAFLCQFWYKGEILTWTRI